VTLGNGEKVEADLIVVGIGVRPVVALAEAAGAKVDRGVVVNDQLETSLAGVYAAGDCARYPDPRTKSLIRIEHWVHSQRMGEIVAENILGRKRRFVDVPFFWTAQYDLMMSYVGHAPSWDEVDLDGDLEARSCKISYKAAGKVLAVLTVGRDKESLLAEAELQRSALGGG
jgi:NADPH-dependent 2,4-dienoyl-CoA reductase/sulfur reductase-like enzyme